MSLFDDPELRKSLTTLGIEEKDLVDEKEKEEDKVVNKDKLKVAPEVKNEKENKIQEKEEKKEEKEEEKEENKNKELEKSLATLNEKPILDLEKSIKEEIANLSTHLIKEFNNIVDKKINIVKEDLIKSFSASHELQLQLTEEFLEKSIKDSLGELNNEVSTKLEKGFSGNDEKFESLGLIEKGIIDTFDDLSKKLNERVQKIETAVAQGNRKSITNMGQVLEKGFDNNQGGKQQESGQNISLKSRRDMIDLLKGLSGVDTGKLNSKYANALLEYEASNLLSKGIIQDLKQNYDINIIK